jgi:putative transposase
MFHEIRMATTLADRFRPAAKTCSACGAVKADPALSERVFSRKGRGLGVDRDLNAAIRPEHLGHAA